MGMNLYDAADAPYMDSAWEIPGWQRFVDDFNEAIPALEIHVAHRPTFALPDEAKHLANQVRRGFPQSVDRKNQRFSRPWQLGLGLQLQGLTGDFRMKFARLIRQPAQHLNNRRLI